MALDQQIKIKYIMKQGKFIAIYGINNIGKSTQAKQLINNLKKANYDAIYVKYPIYNLEPTGPFINDVLRNNGPQQIPETEFQMWFTLNRYQFEPTLKQWLNEGKIVVAEDYSATGIAWGTAKGANLNWMTNLNQYLHKEDFAIFLKGQRHMYAKETNHIHEKDDELIETCNFILQNLADKLGWTQITVKPSITETANNIWNEVNKFLKH